MRKHVSNIGVPTMVRCIYNKTHSLFYTVSLVVTARAVADAAG